jgi:hypothetical protein
MKRTLSFLVLARKGELLVAAGCTGRVEKFQAEPEGVLALLVFPAHWRHRLRGANLGEGWLKHLRRYLSRFPGLHNAEHPTTHFQQNTGQCPLQAIC